MSTSIAWTDSTGAAELTNGKPGPGGRFDAWSPRPRPENDSAHALGTGALYTFEFRVDYGATFTLSKIPRSSMALMDRLCLHLLQGGQITVNTGDASSRSYTCCLAPGAEPPWPEMSDREFAEYSMAFAVISQEATPAPMLCIY